MSKDFHYKSMRLLDIVAKEIGEDFVDILLEDPSSLIVSIETLVKIAKMEREVERGITIVSMGEQSKAIHRLLMSGVGCIGHFPDDLACGGPMLSLKEMMGDSIPHYGMFDDDLIECNEDYTHLFRSEGTGKGDRVRRRMFTGHHRNKKLTMTKSGWK